jgi:hypothetical protein
MIETTLPRAAELWATVPAPDPAPLLEQLATLRLENARLRAQNALPMVTGHASCRPGALSTSWFAEE